jgi:hypothetical protein
MVEQTDLTIRNALKYLGTYAAERHMELIAHQSGDEHLALMVKDLEPAEVSLLAGEGDYTKPSMVSHFINADQFIGALERLGASWGETGNDIDVIMNLRDHVNDFILSVILHAKWSRQIQLIEALKNSQLGEDILIMLALRTPGCENFLREFDIRMMEKGTWQELYGVICDTHLHFALRLQKAVLEISKKDRVDNKSAHGFIKGVLNALSRRAREHVAPTADKPVAESSPKVFSDI